MKLFVAFLLLFNFIIGNAQIITGNFPQSKNTDIVLKKFEGFTEKELTKATTDSLGNFTLAYPKTYKGAALLQIQIASSVIVLLNHENFEMQWQNLQDFTTLKFKNSPENDFFANGILVNQDAEQKLAGLRYLLPLYKDNKTNENWLQNEINNQEQTFEKFIESIPKGTYAKHYLNYRKFLGELQLTNERYKEINRVKQHEIDFTKIDFASEALWYSGLLKEILSSYYQVLELYQDNQIITNKSTEANKIWLKALENQPNKQQEVAEFCFTMLEKKGLTKASEQIALSMLNNKSCQLSDKSTDLYEQYRKLGLGKTAPDIIINSKKEPVQKSLKELNNNYKLVVFGASWCPHCQNDYPSLMGKYKKFKEQYDLEIIYMSLDTEEKAFDSFFKEAPFIIQCNYKGWETQTAKDYHVFATPTYLLLDKELKILAKINSPEHLEDWLKTNSNK